MNRTRSRRKDGSRRGTNGSGRTERSGRGRTQGNGRTRNNSSRCTRNNSSGRANGNWSGSRNTKANDRGAHGSRRSRSNEIRRTSSNHRRSRNRRWNGNGLHHGFLFHHDWRPNGRVLEKRFRHFFGDANAAVRSGVRRDVALMHRVTATEKHGVRHARAVVMRAGRFAVLADIDIRLGDVAEIIDVIAKDSRDVRSVFGQDRVLTGRSTEPRFPGGNRRFANEMFALVEIGMLVRNAHDDFRRTGNAVAVPVTCRRRSRHHGRRGFHFGAAGKDNQGGQHERGF